MNQKLILLSLSFLFFSFSTGIQRKMIRVNGFDIECFVTLQQIKNLHYNKTYYWFKSGEIHQSYADAHGHLLHFSYSKSYRSNQLAEKGMFNYGLKDGEWKNWSEEGKLKSLIEWKKGFKDGKYITYSDDGCPIVIGNYKNNKKIGTWINEQTKDTTYYKKGEQLETKPKGFFKRLFKKKNKTTKEE